MRHTKTAALLSVTALAGMAALAGPAAAVSPFTVSVGGSTATGTHSYTAASKGSISFVVHHGASNVNMGCTSAGASGNVNSGVNVSGDILATINGPATTWTSCVGPGGLAMTVSGVGTWNIKALSGETAGTTDTVVGQIENVSAHVVATANPALCTFDVTGTADGSFLEQKPGGTTGQQDLSVNELGGTTSLTVSNVSGCLGLIANGDKADFVGTYNVTVPDGFVNVS